MMMRYLPTSGRTMRQQLITIVCALSITTMAHAQSNGGGFDGALHAQLRAKKGNLFYSPVCARIGLAMAMIGAHGPTWDELDETLSWSAVAVRAALREWEQASNASASNVVLRFANRVWTQRGRELLGEYVTTMRERFDATPGVVDFAHDAAGARNAINDWAAKATENKIPSLVGDFAAGTAMVLTNAVYFKGKWTQPFPKEATRAEAFFVAGAKNVMVPMMREVAYFQAARIDRALVLERGYGRNGRLVMDIVLPNARDGLGAIEDEYVKGALPRWLSQLSFHRVDVSLPKLKMSSSLDLTPALPGLGVSLATSRTKADFSGIDGAQGFFISEVRQKAELDVDEDGTEAAAATYTMVETAAETGPHKEDELIVFRADHPFLFVIRDRSSSLILFAARVVDPTAH